nr:MAG TPA: hypothetical protein [Caudoviricetes sp.]
MNDNKSTNNSEIVFTISNTTSDMLCLLRDCMKLQERAISLFEDKEEGENVINATVATVRAIRDAIAVNIELNIENLDNATI